MMRADPQRRVMLLAGLGLSAFLVFFPARALVSEKVRVTRLEQRLELLRAENRKLQTEVKRLDDPAELELLARERLGLVKPGEQAYLLVPQPTAPPQAQAPEPSLPSRLWSRLVSLLRGSR